MEEECDGEDNEEGGQYAAKGCGDGAGRLANLVADEDGDIHGEDARAALCHSHEVQQFLAGYPLPAIYHLGLYQRYHGVAAADGEEANVEEGLE